MIEGLSDSFHAHKRIDEQSASSDTQIQGHEQTTAVTNLGRTWREKNKWDRLMQLGMQANRHERGEMRERERDRERQRQREQETERRESCAISVRSTRNPKKLQSWTRQTSKPHTTHLTCEECVSLHWAKPVAQHQEKTGSQWQALLVACEQSPAKPHSGLDHNSPDPTDVAWSLEQHLEDKPQSWPPQNLDHIQWSNNNAIKQQKSPQWSVGISMMEQHTITPGTNYKQQPSPYWTITCLQVSICIVTDEGNI